METSAERRAIVPAFWADFYEQTHIPAAVLVRDRLYVTGHTGTLHDGTFPESAEKQLRQTFRNIALTLAEGGATFRDVVELRSLHVDFGSHSEVVLEVAAEFLDDPYPAWTASGVTELFEPEALIEISCTAVVGQ
jgi:enamine deaminase RidA (YjgF/YER057c/UK114 family)